MRIRPKVSTIVLPARSPRSDLGGAMNRAVRGCRVGTVLFLLVALAPAVQADPPVVPGIHMIDGENTEVLAAGLLPATPEEWVVARQSPSQLRGQLGHTRKTCRSRPWWIQETDRRR